MTEKSYFDRAGVAVFLIGYKKDVPQGEVYPLSQEEEVKNFFPAIAGFGGLAGSPVASSWGV